MIKVCILFSSFLILSACGEKNLNQLDPKKDYESLNSKAYTAKVVYGEDNRKDWYQTPNILHKALAKSTVALFKNSDIRYENDDSVSLRLSSYLNLCPSENFSDQKTGAFCSGFLVAEDLIVTAGHCIRSQTRCDNTSFVFDFALDEKNQDTSLSTADNIYKCTEVIKTVVTGEADFALVRIDRPVQNRTPLKIRRSEEVEEETPLILIGHPSGLPSKISDGGKVRALYDEYFALDVDSFQGNSGSAVFNAETLEVEGILVRGRVDYVYDNKLGCRKSNVCEEGLNGECTGTPGSIEGEHATKIGELVDLISEDGDNETPPDEDGDTSFSSNVILNIPDYSVGGVTSAISNVPSINNLENLKVYVEVEHSYIGDLSIELIGPNGASVLLHRRTGFNQDNIVGTYGFDLEPYMPLLNLGEQPKGKWQLKIVDNARYDSGKLIKWEILF